MATLVLANDAQGTEVRRQTHCVHAFSSGQALGLDAVVAFDVQHLLFRQILVAVVTLHVLLTNVSNFT